MPRTVIVVTFTLPEAIDLWADHPAMLESLGQMKADIASALRAYDVSISPDMIKAHAKVGLG